MVRDTGKRMIMNVRTVIHRQAREQQTGCLGKPYVSESDCEKASKWPPSIVEPEGVK